MPFPLDAQRHGYALVRDHRGLPPHLRDVLAAARVTAEGPVIEMTRAGDQATWAVWPQAGPVRNGDGFASLSEARSIPAWAMAFPARTADGGSAAYPLHDQPGMDGRFQGLADDTHGTGSFASGDGEGAYAVVDGRDLPAGISGVIVTGLRESSQELLFIPAYAMVAHHRGPQPPRTSVPVYDLNDDGAIDEEHRGLLHSHLYVQQLAHGRGLVGDWVPAWNLTQSAGDATGWGTFVAEGQGEPIHLFLSSTHDPATGRIYFPPPVVVGWEETGKTLGLASWERHGPLHPGHADGDKHQFGVNDEGRATNSGHLWTEAKFYMDQVRDAPLRFEDGPWPQVSEFPYPVKVHLRYRSDLTHLWHDGPREGRWDWYTTTAWNPPTITPPYTPVTDDPVPEDGWIDPIEQGMNAGSEGEGASGGDGTLAAMLPRMLASLPAARLGATGSPLAPLQTPFETACPSQYFSAVRWPELQPYDGRFGGPRPAEPAPFVAHLQGFGRHDGGQWDRTTPRLDAVGVAPAVLQPGTANGGVWLTPPEVLLDGYDAAALSATAFALHPAVGLAWGTPTVAGLVADGPQWRYDEAAGTLALVQTDASGEDDSGAVQCAINGELAVNTLTVAGQSVAPPSVDSQTLSGDGTTTLTRPAAGVFQRLALSATGSTDYTRNVDLPVTGAQEGDVMTLQIAFTRSSTAKGTANIRAVGDATMTLCTLTALNGANPDPTFLVHLLFDGSDWLLLDATQPQTDLAA